MTPRITRRATAVLAIAALMVGLTACADPESDSGSPPATNADAFRVYVSLDESGATKAISDLIVAGLKIAAADINGKGGVQGRTIDIEVVDDENNATKAVSLLQKRLSDGKMPDLVYAGGASTVTLSLLPVLTKQKIMSMSATNSLDINDPAKFPYHFSMATPGSELMPAYVQEFKKRGFKKAAMLFANDATGQNSRNLMKAAVTAAGIEWVDAGFETKALDMTSQLNQLKAAGPDVLVVNGYGTAALYAFRGRAQVGWDIPTYGDILASAYPLTSDLKPEELKNVLVQTRSTSLAQGGDVHPGVPALVAAVIAAGHAEGLKGYGVPIPMYGWDILQLQKYVASKAGSTEVDARKAVMESFQPPALGQETWLASGKSGTATMYKWTPENHFSTAGPGWLSFVAPGAFNSDGLYVPGNN